MSTATSTLTAPVQAPLFDLDELLAPVYDEQARIADRELCQHYFRAWCGSFGSLDSEKAGHPEITFAEFQAAADRLAS